MDKRTAVVTVIIAVLIALVLGGTIGAIIYTGNEGNKREITLKTTCIEQGGIWDSYNGGRCMWSQEGKG